MMEQKNKKNLYFLFIVILLFLFFSLIISTIIVQNSKKRVVEKKSSPLFNLPSPTYFYQENKNQPTNVPSLTITKIDLTITPNLTPHEFTGVKEEPIDQELIDFTQQKLSLMEKLPLKTTDFTIDFDYDNDKFIIKLNPPKEETKNKFDEWLKNNYPLIPKEQFIFQ